MSIYAFTCLMPTCLWRIFCLQINLALLLVLLPWTLSLSVGQSVWTCLSICLGGSQDRASALAPSLFKKWQCNGSAMIPGWQCNDSSVGPDIASTSFPGIRNRTASCSYFPLPRRRRSVSLRTPKNSRRPPFPKVCLPPSSPKHALFLTSTPRHYAAEDKGSQRLGALQGCVRSRARGLPRSSPDRHHPALCSVG